MANKAKLKEVLRDLNKTMGFSLVRMGSEEKPREKLSWGVPQLDTFTGGIVKGNFSIIYGGQSVGKTTLAYHTVASAQESGLVVCYIDMERSFNVERATQMGINLDELILITTSETAEQTLDAVIKLTKEAVVDLIVIDSIQAMSSEGEQVTKKGKDKSISDDTMALLARKLSQFFRICAPYVYKANTAVLLIGQIRKDLGSFVVTDNLSGGEALKHWSTLTVHMRTGQGADAPVEKIKQEIVDDDGIVHKTTLERKIGHDVVFKIQKTKVTGSQPQGSDLHLKFLFKTGFLEPKVVEDLSVNPGNKDAEIEAPTTTKKKRKK